MEPESGAARRRRRVQTSPGSVGVVDRAELTSLLQQVADGTMPADSAVDRLVAGPLGTNAAGQVDLGFARVDIHRRLRTGDPEVVYGAGKTAEQTIGIVAALRSSDHARPVLVTRCPPATTEAIRARWP